MKQFNRMSVNCYAVGIEVPDCIIGSKPASPKNDFVNIFAGKKGAFEVVFLNFDRVISPSTVISISLAAYNLFCCGAVSWRLST